MTIVERFPGSGWCTVITSHMHKPHNIADRAMTGWISKNGVFLEETDKNDVMLHLTFSFSWINYNSFAITHLLY